MQGCQDWGGRALSQGGWKAGEAEVSGGHRLWAGLGWSPGRAGKAVVQGRLDKREGGGSSGGSGVFELQTSLQGKGEGKGAASSQENDRHWEVRQGVSQQWHGARLPCPALRCPSGADDVLGELEGVLSRLELLK